MNTINDSTLSFVYLMSDTLNVIVILYYCNIVLLKIDISNHNSNYIKYQIIIT